MHIPLLPHPTKVAVLLAVLFGCLLTAAAAQAVWPGENGAIAFSRTDSESPRSNSDIWIVTRSGEQRRLTASPEVDETSPTFSPNGRWIAYVRRAGEDADIWLMRSDGSEKRPVVDSELDEFQPSFFPSGRSLVFTVFDGEQDWNVRSIRTDGTGLRRQVSSATFPIVSPNSRWLAYSQDGGGGGIRLLNFRSGEVRRLTTGSAQNLDFSPNGRRILFVGQRRCRSGGNLRFAVLTIGLRERRARLLARSCRSEFAGAAWSPNGRKIVYTRKLQQGNRLRFRLQMMTAGGSGSGGAPRHRAGTNEWFPSWQPLP